MVQELLLNLGTGLVVLAAIIGALMLFGCVMAALMDNPGHFDRAPLFIRAIGWLTILGLTAIIIGFLVRLPS